MEIKVYFDDIVCNLEMISYKSLDEAGAILLFGFDIRVARREREARKQKVSF